MSEDPTSEGTQTSSIATAIQPPGKARLAILLRQRGLSPHRGGGYRFSAVTWSTKTIRGVLKLNILFSEGLSIRYF